MSSILQLAKLILLPSFRLIRKLDINDEQKIRLRSKLIDRSLTVITDEDMSLTVDIRSSQVFPAPTFGVLRISLNQLQLSGVTLTVEFRTLRQGFYMFAAPLGAVLLVSTLLTGDPSGILGIGMVIAMGHLIFLGLLPARVPKINRFVQV